MIERYIDKNISVIELSNWAACIYMAPFYVPKGETEQERWKSGEGIVWDIIQKLAMPSDSIKFDLASAQEYLKLIS